MVNAVQGLQRSQPWQQRSQAPQRWPCQASTMFQPGGALQLPSDRWGAAGMDDCRLTEQPLEQSGSRRANMSLCWLHLRPVSNVTVWHDRLPGHRLHIYSIILIDFSPPVLRQCLHAFSLVTPQSWWIRDPDLVLDANVSVYGCVFYTLALLSYVYWSRF